MATLMSVHWWTVHLILPIKNKPCPVSNECPRYDTKQSDGEIPMMMELWGMWSTHSLP